jgi:hypothetical protein
MSRTVQIRFIHRAVNAGDRDDAYCNRTAIGLSIEFAGLEEMLFVQFDVRALLAGLPKLDGTVL